MCVFDSSFCLSLLHHSPVFLLRSQSLSHHLSLPPGLCVPVSLSVSVVFAPLLAESCLSGSQKQNTPLPSLDVHPRSALLDLAGQGADEHERLEEQVQEPQKLRISVVKAFSKDNGADDVGSDGVEVEDGILEGS